MDVDIVAPIVAGAVVLALSQTLFDRVQLYLMTRNHVKVRSELNGEYYTVLDDSQTSYMAADLLAAVHEGVKKVMRSIADQHIKSGISSFNPSVRDGVSRLLHVLPTPEHVKLFELDFRKEAQLAYNRNKTDGIFVCLRDDVVSGSLAEVDTILYIVLHEVAHSMMAAFEPNKDGRTIHSPLFRIYEKFLHDRAEAIGILNPKSIPGRHHCRVILTTPQQSA